MVGSGVALVTGTSSGIGPPTAVAVETATSKLRIIKVASGRLG